MSWNDMAERFAQSQEFSEKYGDVNNEEYLKKLYQNVLNRDADSSGLGYWGEKMNNGTSKGDVLVEFSFSPEYKERIQSTVDTKTTEFYGGSSLDDFNGYSFTKEWLNGRTLYNVFGEDGKKQAETFKFTANDVIVTPGVTGEGSAQTYSYSVNDDGYLVLANEYIRPVVENSSPYQNIAVEWNEDPAKLEVIDTSNMDQFFFYNPNDVLAYFAG